MDPAMAALILASRSPRRQRFLEDLGVAFEVDAADVDECVNAGEAPAHYVVRVARNKAAVVVARRPALPVLAADTTVVVDGEVLGKPADATAARAMLRRLSGRRHEVLGAVVLRAHGEEFLCEVATTVEFEAISDVAIEAYLASGEPFDKAGGYGIQGLGGAFVRAIEGSYSNVVGLPLVETRALLRSAGVATRFDVPAEVAR